MPKKLPPIPDKSQLKFSQSFSMQGLLKPVRNELEKIEEHRSNKLTFKLAEVFMSGLARFGLKYPSLLQLDQAAHNDETITTHLKKLPGVKPTPSDTPRRDILDPVNLED